MKLIEINALILIQKFVLNPVYNKNLKINVLLYILKYEEKNKRQKNKIKIN